MQTSIPSDSGKLAELIQAMTPPQQLCFKQAVVRQAIYFVSRDLPPEAEDEGHRDGIQAALNWLNEPTDEQAQAATVFAASSCWDGGVRYHDYPASFLNPAWTAGQTDVVKAALQAINSAPLPERDAAYQWQVATAQAILQGQEVLPLA